MPDADQNAARSSGPADGKSSHKTAIAAMTVLAIVAAALFLWQVVWVLLVIFGAVLLAIFFTSLANWTAQWLGVSRRTALGIVLLLLAALTTGGLYAIGQPLADQMVALSDDVPRSLNKLREQVQQYRWGQKLLQSAPRRAEDVPVSAREVTAFASNAFTSLTGIVVAMVIVVFLALYFSFDPQTYFRGGIRLLPVRQRPRIEEVLQEVHATLQWWLLGKIVSMILIGILTTVGLWLLGIPAALALGVLAALLTFVPNFGPILSAVPAILLALLVSPMTAVYVILLYVAIQSVESYLITPLIQQRTVSLPPGLTISAQVALGILFGAAGVVVATPLTAAALVLFKRLYVEDTLEQAG